MEPLTSDTIGQRFRTAYDHFNKTLWKGALPPCTVIAAARIMRAKVNGLCAYNAVFDRDGVNAKDSADPRQPGLTQLAINLDNMEGRTDEEVLSTLVHEMAHHWQGYFGTPTRNGYHNAEWAEEMERIGLMPSTQGQYDANNPRIADVLTPEEIAHACSGKKTGQRVSHYIMPGGRFERACRALLDSGFTLHHTGRCAQVAKAEKKADTSKTKYTCPTCGINAWAKLGTHLVCGDCMVPMLPNRPLEQQPAEPTENQENPENPETESAA